MGDQYNVSAQQGRDTLRGRKYCNFSTSMIFKRSLVTASLFCIVTCASAHMSNVMVIGERHSGTNWVEGIMKECYPELTVRPGLVHFKHWFQHESMLHRNGTYVSPESIKYDSLVLVVVRNIYDWTLAMHREPHHAPSHHVEDFREFALKRWKPEDVIDEQLPIDPDMSCGHPPGFVAKEVLPCPTNHPQSDGPCGKGMADKGNLRHNGCRPVYERHPQTGQVLNSILDLRAAKMENLYNISKWMPHVVFLQYERLHADDGWEYLADAIRRERDVKGWDGAMMVPSTDACKFAVGGDVSYKPGGGKVQAAVPRSPTKSKYAMSQDTLKFMNTNTQWQFERLLDYAPKALPDDSPLYDDKRSTDTRVTESLVRRLFTTSY